MLVLSRKIGESISIGDDINIKVVSIDRGSVKLGIDAPKSMIILREELKSAVRQANIDAQSSINDDDLFALHEKLKKN
jgi:carbon storage regulator